MNPEIKKQWIEALTSGEYQQGKLMLGLQGEPDKGEPDKFCCLGVLCELAVKAGVIEPPSRVYEDVTEPDVIEPPPRALGRMLFYGEDRQTSVLPRKVMDWADLDEFNPKIGLYSIASWNDAHAKSFSEIAAMIKESL